ncbi:MAG TPA: hypothetical protein VH724_10135 [Candidatus Angelobacter sp.]|nr:hypothetical protein [Candidatus Angelobacter sp.]
MDYTSGNNLSARVRRTLDDLAAIRQSLLTISDQAVNSSENAAQILDLELAGELKNVVDALRLLLWAYIQALSNKSGRSPQEVLSWYKMELAVEMLRSVRGRSAPAKDGCIAGFERLVNQTLSASVKAPVLQSVESASSTHHLLP